jgi:hypothetical protein
VVVSAILLYLLAETPGLLEKRKIEGLSGQDTDMSAIHCSGDSN